MKSTGVSCDPLRPEVRSFIIHSANADGIIAQLPCARLFVGVGTAHGTPLLNANGMLCQMLGPGLAQAGGHRRLPVPLGRQGVQDGLTGPDLSEVPGLVSCKDVGSPGCPRQLCRELGAFPTFARCRFHGPGLDSLPWAHTLLLPCRLSLRHPRLAELEPWFISPHLRTQEPPLALSTAGRRTTFPEPGQAPPTRVTIADLPLWPQIPSTPSILTLSTEPDAVLPRGNRAALPEPPASPPESLPEPPASLVSLPAPPTQRPGPAKPGACHSSAPTPTALIPRRGLVACDLRAWHPRLSPSTRQGLEAPPGGKDKVRASPQSALHLHDLLTSSPSPSPPVPPPPPCPRPFAPAASSP